MHLRRPSSRSPASAGWHRVGRGHAFENGALYVWEEDEPSLRAALRDLSGARERSEPRRRRGRHPSQAGERRARSARPWQPGQPRL